MKTKDPHSLETEQILHLQQLIVTLKEDYEKQIESLEKRLNEEEEKGISLLKEVASLEKQHLTLKNLLQNKEQSSINTDEDHSLKEVLLKVLKGFETFETSYNGILESCAKLERKNRAFEKKLSLLMPPSKKAEKG